MGFFSRFLAPRDDATPQQGFQVLTFGPAIVRMTIAGKDAGTELDALAAAVAKLQYPQGFSTDRVFAAASEMARLIKIDGIAGVTDRMKAELAPDDRADAMRLALVALFTSDLRDSDDVGILSGMAEHIGMTRAEFDALCDAAEQLSDQEQPATV